MSDLDCFVSLGHASITFSKSGSDMCETAAGVPESVPRFSESPVFPGNFADCSDPLGVMFGKSLAARRAIFS